MTVKHFNTGKNKLHTLDITPSLTMIKKRAYSHCWGALQIAN